MVLGGWGLVLEVFDGEDEFEAGDVVESVEEVGAGVYVSHVFGDGEGFDVVAVPVGVVADGGVGAGGASDFLGHGFSSG